METTTPAKKSNRNLILAILAIAVVVFLLCRMMNSGNGGEKKGDEKKGGKEGESSYKYCEGREGQTCLGCGTSCKDIGGTYAGCVCRDGDCDTKCSGTRMVKRGGSNLRRAGSARRRTFFGLFDF